MANEIIRPTLLPARADPVASEVVPSDNGSSVAGVTWADGVNAAVPPASQVESEAGVINTKRMTPLTTKQAIDAQTPLIVNTAITALNLGTMSQEESSDYTPTSGLAAVALSNDYNDLDNLPTLGSAAATDASDYATAAQGSLADSSIQPGNAALVPAGGTIGQVLVKNSGTNYDTGWVSSAAATAVSYAPQTLTDSQAGQARANIDAGILPGFRNKIINGDFPVWQRGTTQTANGYGSVDRWMIISNGTSHSVERLDAVPGQKPHEPAYILRNTVTSVAGAGNFSNMRQYIEDVRTLAGKKATVTFWARGFSGANFVAVDLNQSFGSGGSATIEGIAARKIAINSTWTKYTFALDVPSIAGKTIGGNSSLQLRFWFDAGTSYSVEASGLGHQSGIFDLSRISLVEGDATAEEDPFSPRHIQQELALCQRYYQRIRSAITSTATAGGAWGTTLNWPTMRSVPSLSIIETQESENVNTVFYDHVRENGCRHYVMALANGNVVLVRTTALDAEL